MEAVLEQIPNTGQLSLTIQVSTAFNYTATAARKLAGRFAAEEIGYLLRPGAPTLVASERILWRVPLMLATPQTGILGEVGSIDIDVETGKLSITPDQIATIIRNGERFAATTTSPKA
jgi:hypothetical protein